MAPGSPRVAVARGGGPATSPRAGTRHGATPSWGGDTPPKGPGEKEEKKARGKQGPPLPVSVLFSTQIVRGGEGGRVRAFGHLPASGRAGVHGGGCGSQPVCVPPPPRGNPPSPPCCDQGGGQGVGAVIVTPPKAPPTQRDTGTRMGTPQLPAFGVAKKAAPKRGQREEGCWGGQHEVWGRCLGVPTMGRVPRAGTDLGQRRGGSCWERRKKRRRKKEKTPGEERRRRRARGQGAAPLGQATTWVPRHRVPKS